MPPSTDSRKCPFCSACFSRVDAARRHAKRCPQREGRNLLDRKRGRQARSCDQCSRVKVHCNLRSEGPCERCIPRGLECTFTRHQTDIAILDTPAVRPCGSDGQRGGRIPLSFLLNATDDHQDFLTEEAIWMEPDAVPLGPTCLPSLSTDIPSDELLDFIDPSMLLLFDHGPDMPPSALEGSNSAYGQGSTGKLTVTTAWENKISARLGLLEVELCKHAASSYDLSLLFRPQSYRSFFIVPNVHHFITTFCRKRHYRYPIIHWPTFQAESAPLPLLLVVCLTGAAYSLEQGNGVAHAVEARQFYKLADAYIFHALEKQSSDQPAQTDPASSIELCQAALLMYALDTLLTGDLAMQHTAVAIRLPMLISTIRGLGYVGVRHEVSEDWQAFIRREEMIRSTAWTFCADCLATLTCNKPPGFTIMEMRGDLPCEPNVWEGDAVSLAGSRKRFGQNISFHLRDLMAHWLEDDWPNPIHMIRLPVFYLHIMLCAFQQVIFNSHVAMSLKQQSANLLLALSTWRHLWDSTIEGLADHDRKWLGVAQHVTDLEHLMRRMIEVAVGPKASTSTYLQRIPSIGTAEIHEFMQTFVLKV